jgi:hypothetical protein
MESALNRPMLSTRTLTLIVPAPSLAMGAGKRMIWDGRGAATESGNTGLRARSYCDASVQGGGGGSTGGLFVARFVVAHALASARVTSVIRPFIGT